MAPTAREIAGDKYILWGASWSLYTAKVRPYLIKKRVDYVEINPSHPHYNDTIIKKIPIEVPILVDPTVGNLIDIVPSWLFISLFATIFLLV